MCPLAVVVASGRCFDIKSCVRPGTDLSFLFLMAFNNVTLGGGQKHWCRYCANFG